MKLFKSLIRYQSIFLVGKKVVLTFCFVVVMFLNIIQNLHDTLGLY